MSNRVQCKFFERGACLKGDHCEFSHDWKAPPNNICSFYQKGACAYATRCRYDHVKPSRSISSSPSPPDNVSSRIQHSPSAVPFCTPTTPAWSGDSVLNGNYDPSDHSMCSFAAVGDCPRGEKCPHVHGDLCPLCGKQCLHPFRPHEREEHLKTCEKKHKHLEALTHEGNLGFFRSVVTRFVCHV